MDKAIRKRFFFSHVLLSSSLNMYVLPADLYILMFVWLLCFSLTVFSGVLTPNVFYFFFLFFFVSSCIQIVDEQYFCAAYKSHGTSCLEGLYLYKAGPLAVWHSWIYLNLHTCSSGKGYSFDCFLTKGKVSAFNKWCFAS